MRIPFLDLYHRHYCKTSILDLASVPPDKEVYGFLRDNKASVSGAKALGVTLAICSPRVLYWGF